jgi:hypothetical protein
MGYEVATRGRIMPRNPDQPRRRPRKPSQPLSARRPEWWEPDPERPLHGLALEILYQALVDLHNVDPAQRLDALMFLLLDGRRFAMEFGYTEARWLQLILLQVAAMPPALKKLKRRPTLEERRGG